MLLRYHLCKETNKRTIKRTIKRTNNAGIDQSPSHSDSMLEPAVLHALGAALDRISVNDVQTVSRGIYLLLKLILEMLMLQQFDSTFAEHMYGKW